MRSRLWLHRQCLRYRWRCTSCVCCRPRHLPLAMQSSLDGSCTPPAAAVLTLTLLMIFSSGQCLWLRSTARDCLGVSVDVSWLTVAVVSCCRASPARRRSCCPSCATCSSRSLAPRPSRPEAREGFLLGGSHFCFEDPHLRQAPRPSRCVKQPEGFVLGRGHCRCWRFMQCGGVPGFRRAADPWKCREEMQGCPAAVGAVALKGDHPAAAASSSRQWRYTSAEHSRSIVYFFF